MQSDSGIEQLAAERGISPAQVQRLRRTRGVTDAGLRLMPQAALQRAIRRLDYPDMPQMRVDFRRRQQHDARGAAPVTALVTALGQLDSARARRAARTRVAGVPTGHAVEPAALVAGGASNWVALGPGNIGGRTRSIVVHPTTPTTLWAGSVAGGVWRTDNAGAAWQPVDDFMANLAVTCMVMDPTDPNRLYAGTGEGFYNGDSLRGAGIFRTVDGTTWRQIASTATPDFQDVNRLAISADGSVLLAATRTGVFRSADPDRLTWTNVLGVEMATVQCHPTDPNLAVAGSLRTGNAYFTTDGGQTWTIATHATPWHSRVELVYAVANPTTVYASVNVNGGQIWQSTDGGATYTQCACLGPDGRPALYLGDQGWYGNVIWAGDPTNPNLVVVGGVDLWRSTDGGASLIDISTWWDPRSAHADQHCIVSDPGYDGQNNKTAYFGNDGGIYTTSDITQVGSDPQQPRVSGWTELDHTYGVTQFYAGAANVSSGTIIGGAQDNGTLRYIPGVGSEGWTSMFGGDGGWCAADTTDPNYFYGEYVYLNIHRSSNGGATSEYISGQYWDGTKWTWKPIPYSIPDAMTRSALFIAPFVLDANNPQRLLAGGLSLWQTEDAKTPNTSSSGPSWTEIKPSVGRAISAIVLAPTDSATVWVGHEDGQVFMTTNSTDASPAWQKIDNGGGPQALSVGRYCTAITIDPTDATVVYVLFGGYVRGNVWKTTDNGATWNNIGAMLPEAPARALAVHPSNSSYLYLGTEVGLFASEDGGASWSPTNEGPTNCSVDDLFWMGTTLVCVTHGRGMFQIDLSNP